MERRILTPEDLLGRSDLLDDGSHYATALREARERELAQLAGIHPRRKAPAPYDGPRPLHAHRPHVRRPRPAPTPLPVPPAPQAPVHMFPAAGPIERRPVDHDVLRRQAASAL